MADCQTVTDWAATGAMLQGIGTVGGAVTVLIAAIIGANTFQKWKQQSVAERRIDQAQHILVAAYKVRKQLKRVRSPMMWVHETDAAQKQLEESGAWAQIAPEDRRKKFAYAQAYYNRLNAARPDETELEECQPMARALFGEELETAIEKLNHQFWIVKVNTDAYRDDVRNNDVEFRRKVEAAIWTGMAIGAANEVDQVIEQSMQTIERACLPELRMEKIKAAPAKADAGRV